MKKHYDVIVIGVGAMGASTCFHLARQGVKTLGLEQFDIAHNLGSSHGHSRMIRKAYFKHPNYVPLLHRAYSLWEELEALSNRKLLFKVGGVFVGPRDRTLVSGALSAAQQHRLPHELLTASELRNRWPQLVVPENWHTLYEPDSGFLLPERGVSTYAEFAMRAGAEIHGREAVREWKREGSHYRVQTEVESYAADRLIFCGGAWSEKLLRDLNVPLKVTRQVMAWVWPHSPEQFELGRMPVWAIDSLDGGLYYGFPMNDEAPGMKFAHHLPTENTVDPDHCPRELTEADRGAVQGILTRYLPAADGPLLAMKTCLYTNSPDGHFIVDRLPNHPGVQIACGFSGHGFKFASVIGSELASAAVSGRYDPTMDFLGLTRFQS